MRQITILLIISFATFMLSCGGAATDSGKEKTKDLKLEVKENYQPGEEAAQQVLLAYRTKNLELLKEYAGSMMRMALDEDAMDRPDYEKQLNNWDGSIKEVRYDSDVVTFEKTYYAYAHYLTEKDDIDKFYMVVLQSKDKEKWVISLNPLRTLTKSHFEEKSEQLPE